MCRDEGGTLGCVGDRTLGGRGGRSETQVAATSARPSANLTLHLASLIMQDEAQDGGSDGGSGNGFGAAACEHSRGTPEPRDGQPAEGTGPDSSLCPDLGRIVLIEPLHVLKIEDLCSPLVLHL